MNPSSSSSDDRQDLKAALKEDGVRGAVVFLNSLTDHRFTSMYRFDNAILRNITFYDRQNPEIQTSDAIPVEASYCVFVRDLSSKFTVQDAGTDERVLNHAKRETVKRYCGVPLLDGNGKMFGTICHFDFEPGRISQKEIELLEYMARLLQDHGVD